MILSVEQITNLGGRIAFDVETTGGNLPWLGRLVGLGVWAPDEDVYGYVPCDGTVESYNAIKHAVSTWKESAFLIGHNAKYELHWLGFTREQLAKYRIFDTMVAEHLLREELTKDLGSLEARHMGTSTKAGYLSASDQYGGIKNIVEWPVRLAGAYCENDCRITYIVAELQTKLLKQQRLSKLFGRQMRYLKALYAIEARGLLLDKGYLYASRERAESLLLKAEEAIEHVLSRYNLSPLKTYNSPKAVSKMLYEDLAIPKPVCPPSLMKSPKAAAYKSTCTGKDLLKTLKHPVIKPLLEWKSIKILIGYMNAYLKFQEPSENSLFADLCPPQNMIKARLGTALGQDFQFAVIHSSFNQTGTVTGRLSSVRPNLQQVKSKYAGQMYDTELDEDGEGKGFGVRPAFIARDGYKLYSIDYKQMEVVVFAALSRDPRLLEIVTTGEDAHELTAAGMSTEKSVVTRKQAKTINFGVLYGLGIPGLASLLGVDEEVAQMLYNQYLATYSQVRPWMNAISEELNATGEVSYWSGRKRRIPNRNLHYRGVNSLVQGGCADIVAEAAIGIDEYLGSYGDNDGIVAIIHDEFLIELKQDDNVGAKIAKIQELMSVPHAVGIPLLTDVEVGYRWNAAYDSDDLLRFTTEASFYAAEMRDGTLDQERFDSALDKAKGIKKPSQRKAKARAKEEDENTSLNDYLGESEQID